MGIRIGVASLMTLLVLLVGISFSTHTYVSVKEAYINKNCFKVFSAFGDKAELLNVYFLRIGAGSFFEYINYNKTFFICYNANLNEKTKSELFKIMNRI